MIKFLEKWLKTGSNAVYGIDFRRAVFNRKLLAESRCIDEKESEVQIKV